MGEAFDIDVIVHDSLSKSYTCVYSEDIFLEKNIHGTKPCVSEQFKMLTYRERIVFLIGAEDALSNLLLWLGLFHECLPTGDVQQREYLRSAEHMVVTNEAARRLQPTIDLVV
jgi:hypothetical protein